MINRSTRNAFTLVEVLLVVVILGILAATVIPSFNDTSDDAKLNALQFNLHTLRAQIELYKLHHGGDPPAVANNLEALTKKTDADGSINASGAFGPYLATGIPENPNTGINVVTGGTYPFSAESGNDGWIYDETTGNIAPDQTAHLGD